MGETRVDIQHLLEDLRDAYSGSLEETILTEIVANALDSGARKIDLAVDAPAAALTVIDNGTGMLRRELSRYHDIAASTKVRGQGIGFAGVGIKLGLLLCREVITETRRGKTHVATSWHLASKYRAPWSWIPPAGRVAERGTAVTLHLDNSLSPLLDPGYLEAAIRRHYRALLEPRFREVLADYYGDGITFTVGGKMLLPGAVATGEERTEVSVRFPRKRKPSAVGFLARSTDEVPADQRGLAVSTLGKVIKVGWDWLGLAPAQPEFVSGIVEAPGLSASLTLNKADFIRTGARGATYLAYRRAIQQVVGALFSQWGDEHRTEDQRRRKAARPVERDLEQVLVDMAGEYPLLSTLVEHRKGGQRKLPIGQTPDEDGRFTAAGAIVGRAELRDAAESDSVSPSEGAEAGVAVEVGPEVEVEAERDATSAVSKSETPSPALSGLPGKDGVRRRQRYGLTIDFESRPDSIDLGRLVESTVWVNSAHPAYRRAAASRSEGYHLALSVAMVLAPLAVVPASERDFVAEFLTRWGSALDEENSSGRRRSGRRRKA